MSQGGLNVNHRFRRLLIEQKLYTSYFNLISKNIMYSVGMRGDKQLIKKPNFFIVGAAKSGTSSLFHYLDLHPDIYMSAIKEPHYFCHDYFPAHFTGPGDEGFSENRIRTTDDYMKLFEPGIRATIRGEGSVYYAYYPEIAERIYEFNPESKVVLILRNPVDRAFSAYMHTLRDGRETLTFEEALEQEPQRREKGFQPLWWYRELGRYSAQVERYMKIFPSNQLKILLYDDLRNTPKVVRETLRYLGLNTDVNIDTSTKHNISGIPKSRKLYRFFAEPNPVKEVLKPFLPKSIRQKLGQQAKAMTLRKETMNPETRQLLRKDYREDVEKLQGLINRDLSTWLNGVTN